MSIIYCDEAGNTGANLLDPEQPIFVLASNDFSVEEAGNLLLHVNSGQANEPKFSTLKRTESGIARIIAFLADPRLNRHRVQIDVYHKRYMIVTKMVDLVAETIFHQRGMDLYAEGGNLVMSNLLFYQMPIFCGGERTSAFLQAFVDLIRQGVQKKDAYFEAGRNLASASSVKSFQSLLWYFTEPKLFDIWYQNFDKNHLDPAIPSLFHHIATWGERKVERFDVIHDHSKPILATQETFVSMMAGEGEDSTVIGPDRRTILFPLRARTLSQGDSALHPQLQVADLCAGSLNHFYKCQVAKQEDELSRAVEQLGCLDWGEVFLLPQPHFTPEALGTVGRTGSNIVDEMVKYLEGKV